ncbi:hypothetical protein FXO37_09500 [Capsicum annuum]|nr:hypothetical protein FXO37_09500 [Capsicum annuum]
MPFSAMGGLVVLIDLTNFGVSLWIFDGRRVYPENFTVTVTGSDSNGVLPASIIRNRSQGVNFSRDCGLYIMTYARCLTFGECVPNVDFDLDLLRTRYASILWHYGSRKEEEKTQSDDEAPMRPPMEIGITDDHEVHDI